MVPAKVKPAMQSELLDQIDVRDGTIESASDVANSDKLVAHGLISATMCVPFWRE